MDVGSAMITMPREQAREKLRAFRANTHKDAEQLYREAEKGYAALAQGTPLIQLSKAFEQAGYDEQMRPRLAFARADRREVRMIWRSNEDFICFDSSKGPSYRTDTLYREINVGRRHGKTWTNRAGERWGSTVEAFALVPMLPADKRPVTGQLSEWHILWEVDVWYSRSQTAKASRDPFLLKHIGGDLYAVLAQWDLTPLEMAILEARPRT